MQPDTHSPVTANSAIDTSFSVPFVHRLRFTRDVFGPDASVLIDLLEASDGKPARVQFWLDSHVVDAQPDLMQRIYELSKKFHHRISLAGNVQTVPGGEEGKNDILILERMLKVFHAHD